MILMVTFTEKNLSGKVPFYVQCIVAATIFRCAVSNQKTLHRSSRPKMFCKKGVLEIFAKFTGKHLCQKFFFNKLAG